MSKSGKLEHFVTLFDNAYMANGLALYNSLTDYSGDFLLWVVCMDQETLDLLEGANFDRVRTIPVDQIETPQLRELKKQRTIAEYCWTLTPFTFDAVFERAPDAERVTYVDADVMLLDDPRPIFKELEDSGKEILITEHDYLPHWDQTWISGRFCVQFIPATRHGSSMVRRWWQDRCLEWCHARSEAGKFGDQGYLDQWPSLFPESVHVSTHNQWFQAPWNSIKFHPGDAIVYHFHALTMSGSWVFSRGAYPLHKAAGRIFYRALQRRLKTVFNETGLEPTRKYSLPPGAFRRRLSEVRLVTIRRLARWFFPDWEGRPPLV